MNKNELTWVLDKDIKYFAPILNTSRPKLPVWFMQIIWPLIFLAMNAILYTISNNTYPLRKKDMKYLLFGIFTGLTILGFYIFLDFYAPFIYFDGNTQKFFVERINNDLIQLNKTKRQVILSNNIFMSPDEKEMVEFSITTDDLERLKQLHNIKTQDFDDWIRIKEEERKYSKENLVPGPDHLWAHIKTHTERLVVILLTVAFIVASWNRKIYHKLAVWIYGTLLLELIATATWSQYTTTTQRSIWIWANMKTQIVTSCLTVCILFMLYGLAQN